MNLREELDAVIGVLRNHGIDYAICGGMAMAVHGHPRFTEDLDLLIREEDVDHVKAAVASLGFLMDCGWVTSAGGTDAEIRLFWILRLEGDDHALLKLFCVTPILEEPWASRTEYELDGKRVSAVSREGLIAMKTISGRDQDIVDIRKLQGIDRD